VQVVTRMIACVPRVGSIVLPTDKLIAGERGTFMLFGCCANPALQLHLGGTLALAAEHTKQATWFTSQHGVWQAIHCISWIQFVPTKEGVGVGRGASDHGIRLFGGVDVTLRPLLSELGALCATICESRL